MSFPCRSSLSLATTESLSGMTYIFIQIEDRLAISLSWLEVEGCHVASSISPLNVLPIYAICK